jgi:hypothetical protein
MTDITSANTDQMYIKGYLDAFSDVLDMLQSVAETPEVYEIKETLRKTIAEGEGQ